MWIPTLSLRPSLKIHGAPTYETLKNMKNELKANATSVTSTLGGGTHGHLGKVLNGTEYLGVSAVPYVNPVLPPPLVIPAGTTLHESNRLREEHKQLTKLACESIDVEKAMIKQVVGAVDAIYLKDLCN